MTSALFARLLSFVVVLGCLLFSSGAVAAELKTEVSARRVGVGQSFQVQVTAPVEDDQEPKNPRLQVSGAAVVRGPSVGSQRSIVMRNFNVHSETNVIATWTVNPTKAGKLIVGPASFEIGGQIVQGDAVEVLVLDQPQGPARRRPMGRSPFGIDPFDPFGNDPFGRHNDPFDRTFQAREAPQQWQLSHAADPVAFLHAFVDKKEVVLGEPVRLTILAYGSRGEFFEQAAQSPSLAEFVSFPVVEDQMAEPLYQTTIGEERFLVKKLREYVLVPLSSGRLSIGSMSTVLQSKRRTYPPSPNAQGMRVSTLPLEITVVDPPEKGQPAGYFPGDVGSYRLTAEVVPRQLEQGEYIKVLVTISGRGYVPSKVLLPESNLVTWNSPTVRGEPEVKNGTLQGSRTLDYSVRVTASGNVDLGEVRLPYYDAKRDRYRVAKADLGSLQVQPRKDAPPAAPAQGPSAPEPGETSVALAPRTALGPPPQKGMAVPAWGWWAVLSAPLGALTLRLVTTLGTVFLTRRKKGRRADTRTHLAQARAHFQKNDRGDALAALERSLFSAIEEASGLRARGVLRSELSTELESAGIDQPLARRIAELLHNLETSRYAPSEQEGGEDLVSQTESLTSELSRLGKKKKRKVAS